jgi:hypothetical protein
MKPMLKAPGTKRLKLNYDEALSNFAFKFSLRCYSMAGVKVSTSQYDETVKSCVHMLCHLLVGRCRLSVSKPALKAPIGPALEAII